MSLVKSEFECNCCGELKLNDDFFDKMRVAREIADTPFVITSGYRCEKHNTKVGGVPTSSHVKGYAADIRARNSRERFRILLGLKEAGFTRIGIAEDFIHVDNDPDKAEEVVWLY